MDRPARDGLQKHQSKPTLTACGTVLARLLLKPRKHDEIKSIRDLNLSAAHLVCAEILCACNISDVQGGKPTYASVGLHMKRPTKSAVQFSAIFIKASTIK